VVFFYFILVFLLLLWNEGSLNKNEQ